nr:unnamed protein product [Callosobruchus analis]
MNGKECDAFWKVIKDTSSMTAKFEFEPQSDCYVCEANNCNRGRYMDGAPGLTIPIGLIGIFSIILTKIV